MTLPDWTEIAPELICIGVNAAICGVLYKFYTSDNSTIEKIKAAPELILSDSETTVGIRDFVNHHGKTSGENSNEVAVPYAVIEGNVTPVKSLLESHYQKGVKGVVRHFSIVEHARSHSRSGFWYDSTRTIQVYSNTVPFCLGHLVQVTDIKEATELDLEVTYNKFEPASSSLTDHIWGWIVGNRQKGIQSTEHMLLDDTKLTAIGEVVLNKDNDSFRIQSPTDGSSYFLVREPTKSLVRRLESGSKVLKICLMVFGGVGLVIGAFAAYKYYRRYKELESIARVQETLEQIIRDRVNRPPPAVEVPRPAGEEDVPRLPDVNSCVVCLGQPREVILLDCGHVCVCANCANEIMRHQGLCPVCRAPIDRVATAYIS